MRRKCSGFAGRTEVNEEVTIVGDVIKKVAKLSYLRDVLSSGGGMQEAVTAKIRCGRKKFKDIASVRCKIRVAEAEKLVKSCVRRACDMLPSAGP